MGASPNPARFSFIATEMLKEYGHEVVLYGRRKGDINGTEIRNETPSDETFDTVTLYLNPLNQEGYMDYITQLKPKRVIFNPGTENPEFEHQLKENGIEALEACTLVMLRTGQF